MNRIMPNEWNQMLLKYRFAMTLLNAELEILLKEHEFRTGNNPVEHIKNRLKSENSIMKKLEDKGYEPTVENVEKYIHDIVGFRIVCQFLSDVYDIVEIIKSSHLFQIKEEIDYIKNKKESGYSSYHMIILIPIHLEGKKEYVEAEIQIRTVAMDFWASLDHKLQYKLPKDIPVYLKRELLSCSDEMQEIDKKMQHLYDIVKKYTDKK